MLKVRGGGGGISNALGAVYIHLYMTRAGDGNQEGATPIRISCWTHAITNLKANLLLGTDALNRGMLLGFNRRSCARATRPVTITTDQRIVLPPQQLVSVPIKKPPKLQTADFLLFTRHMPSFLQQVIDCNTTAVLAYNNSLQPVEIPRNVSLGTAELHQADSLELLHDSCWIQALPSGESTEKPTDCFSTQTLEGPTGARHFGVNIYGEPDIRQKIDDMVKDFEQLFTDYGKVANIPEEDWLTMPLVSDWQTSDAKMAHKVYPLRPKDREFLDEVHDKLHQQGRMEWTQKPTPSGFPVFVVWKEVDGKRKGRVVVDIRGLNKVTVADAYPLPLQTDVTSAVAGCYFISVVDASAFFHQFPVKREERCLLTFVSHRGAEQSNVAPMGFKNLPPYAQKLIDKVLRKHGCTKFAKAFMDDVTIFSHDLEEHLQQLRRVFEALAAYNLTLSLQLLRTWKPTLA
jgi:hypothetical protein